MIHHPASDNDRHMIEHYMQQGATREQAESLLEDFYLEMDAESKEEE